MKARFRSIFQATVVLFLVHPAASATFCQNKFGNSVSMRFVPADSNGGIVVEDGMLGSKTTVVEPKVSPTGFICVVAPSTDQPDCIKHMKLDGTTFKNKYCVSEIFSLKKLCPAEVLKYPSIVSSEVCRKK